MHYKQAAHRKRMFFMARKRFIFWLDDTKGQEYQLIAEVGELKKQRSFSQTIRDGIRLICDLRDGNLDVLFELFPWVRVEFLKYMEGVQPKTVMSETALAPDVEKYLQEILEKLDQAQSNSTATPILKPVSNGLKPIGGLKSIAPPVLGDDDEDLLTVTQIQGDGISVTQRFLQSFQTLQNIKR